MARPSLHAERKKTIMAAFTRCISKQGLEAASLDEIAKEAGMQRSLVRHFAGNREDLVSQVGFQNSDKIMQIVWSHISRRVDWRLVRLQTILHSY